MPDLKHHIQRIQVAHEHLKRAPVVLAQHIANGSREQERGFLETLPFRWRALQVEVEAACEAAGVEPVNFDAGPPQAPEGDPDA